LNSPAAISLKTQATTHTHTNDRSIFFGEAAPAQNILSCQAENHNFLCMGSNHLVPSFRNHGHPSTCQGQGSVFRPDFLLHFPATPSLPKQPPTPKEDLPFATVEYWTTTLPDGFEAVPCRDLRGSWFLRVANRRLAVHVPETCKVDYLVHRLYQVFKDRPNTVMDWDAAARDYVEGLALCENLAAFRCRFIDKNPEDAASHGIVPMQLGIVAPLLALLDYGAGDESHAQTTDAGRPRILTQLRHARRAHSLVKLNLAIRKSQQS
jgi:hypothetical protein